MSWLATTQGIITLISSGVALLGTIIGLGINLYKAVKQIIKDKNWNKIAEIANSAMAAAEKSGLSGADKKDMVIKAVEAGCKEMGITVDLSQLSKYIDDCIDFANKINKK